MVFSHVISRHIDPMPQRNYLHKLEFKYYKGVVKNKKLFSSFSFPR